jgi:hypothetical protein
MFQDEVKEWPPMGKHSKTPTFLLELPLVVEERQAKRVRFKSKRRGLDSIENKRNETGLRFVLQKSEEGNAGWLM